MFIKRHVRQQDGKKHVYYSLCESTRLSPHRVRQRRLLNLGELHTPQSEGWQRSIEVVEENGQASQKRLFTDREGEGQWSTLRVRKPRQFGNGWRAGRLLEELPLERFFTEPLSAPRGPEDWARVVELLAVNRVGAPGSELSIHERWFDRRARDQLLGRDPEVAGKDRLYRTLDKPVVLKPALEKHLAGRWQDLFGADTQVGRTWMVEVWFTLRDGRPLGLPRITEPQLEQRLLLHPLQWKLPEPLPPKIYAKDVP